MDNKMDNTIEEFLSALHERAKTVSKAYTGEENLTGEIDYIMGYFNALLHNVAEECPYFRSELRSRTQAFKELE